LLDNWRLADIRKAARLRTSSLITHHSSPLLEVSGGVTLANVGVIARTGVDRISIGRLTHSAPALDVSLEVVS
jgi:nicotinate-nucleotide pyrophosphorylase (carboxylating)